MAGGALSQEPRLPDQLCGQQGDLGPQSSFREGLLFEGSFLNPLSGLWGVLEGHNALPLFNVSRISFLGPAVLIRTSHPFSFLISI